MPSPRIVGAKIVQVAVVGGGEYSATLFALDEDGRVWRIAGDAEEANLRTTWRPISLLPTWVLTEPSRNTHGVES